MLGLSAAKSAYEEKLQKSGSTKCLFEAGWKLEELNVLLQTNQQLIVEVQAHFDMFTAQDDSLHSNLAKLKSSLQAFVRDLTRQKRASATHIFVIMISSYERKHKPYAIPIQCIPYTSLDHSTMRRVLNNIVLLMKERNMTVVSKFA